MIARAPGHAGFWTKRRMFWSLIALAAVLRLVAAIPDTLHHGDELFQYLEPAHHIAVGPWVTTWEMRAGIRTWLIPALLAGPMAIGHMLDLTVQLPRVALVALSLTVVGAATALGMRLSRLHGAFAGLVAATWFELVFFAPRALSEPVALALLMGACWCLLTGVRSDARVFAAGLLLGLAFAARLQVAPAIVTLALWEGRLHWRRVWLPLVAGGLAGLAVDGAVDLTLGQVPLRWVLENVRINLIEHTSERYGVFPPGMYLGWILGLWGWAIPLLALSWIGARRYPVLMAMALVHLAAHSLIPHKEYRFVLPTTALLVVLAGIGTADVLRGVPRRWFARATAGAAIGWLGVSGALAASPGFAGMWGANRELGETLRAAGRVPGVCGLAIYKQMDTLSAAYAFYDRATPIYVLRGAPAAGEARAYAGAFNVVMADRAAARELPGFTRDRCRPDAAGRTDRCLFVRRGGCSGAQAGALEINAVAVRIGD